MFLEIIRQELEVKDAYLWQGIPTYVIRPTPELDNDLNRLRQRIEDRGKRIHLQQQGDTLLLQILPATKMASRQLPFNYSFLLFILTIITVTISGYFIAADYRQVLTILGRRIDTNDSILVLTIAYALSIMGTLGIHELGHTLACRRHHIEASMPIFIPGIPFLTIGTFGAIIRQKGPALNRNQLFDIGFSGPILGFVLSLVVSILGYSWSIPISEGEYEFLMSVVGGEPIVLPLLFQRLSAYIFPSTTPGGGHVLHPIAFAGWITALLTFLNIFPIGQLDGGHISHALFGAKWHRRLSYLMIPVMFVLGWWSMAFLILIFLRYEHPGTLDKVSGVSTSRKILSLLIVVIFICYFTPSTNSLILDLLYP